MNVWRQAAALAAIAALPAAGAWAWKGRPPAAEIVASADGMIAPAEAARLGAAALWVDARPAPEYGNAHVPGALALNEDRWDELVPTVLERWTPGRTVIVYCDGGTCRSSLQVAARLRDAGVAPVTVLRGGWPAWIKETGAR